MNSLVREQLRILKDAMIRALRVSDKDTVKEAFSEQSMYGACFMIGNDDSPEIKELMARYGYYDYFSGLWDANIDDITPDYLLLSGNTECSGGGMQIKVKVMWSGSLAFEVVGFNPRWPVTQNYKDMIQELVGKWELSEIQQFYDIHQSMINIRLKSVTSHM